MVLIVEFNRISSPRVFDEIPITTMVLKRKRSDSEISSTSSLLSSPLSSSNYMSIDGYQGQSSTNSMFASRTRKRHRDNRPSEEDIHQKTLSLLFGAQSQPSNYQSPSPFASQPQIIQSVPSSSISRQQSSLHSFWALPSSIRQSSPSSNSSSSSTTPSTTPAHNTYFQVTNCEDCDALLNSHDSGNAMDVDMIMDIDMDEGNHGCTSCGKQVCHSCAVSNMGEQRNCLNCAGRSRQLVGGIGWMS